MIIEGGDRRRLLVARDRRHKLKFQPLIALAAGQQFASPAEERIRGRAAGRRKPERRGELADPTDPTVTPPADGVGVAGENMFVHPEHLHPSGIVRRLVPEAVRHHIDQPSACRQPASQRRINRVARGRRQYERRGAKGGTPVAAVLNRLQQLAMIVVVAVEMGDRADQMRKRFEIAARLEITPVQDRRKAQRLRVIRAANGRNQTIDTLDRVLEFGASTEDASHTGFDEQPALDELGAECAGTDAGIGLRRGHLNRPCGPGAWPHSPTGSGRC